MKSTKSVPAQSGTLVDGKHGLHSRPNSITADSGKLYTPVTSTPAPTPLPVPTTTERPILGYLSPAEAAKLEPTPNLGFDHYPNELPAEPKRRQPVVYIRPRPVINSIQQEQEPQQQQQYPYQLSRSTERPEISLPSIDMEPPRENSRRRIRPIAIAPVSPQPISANEYGRPSYGYSTPKPFESVVRTTASPNSGYYYGPTSYALPNQPPQALPVDVNALEGGLLPPLPPLYQRHRVPVQQYQQHQHDYNSRFAPEYNEVTNTRNGFRYVLPHQYHEEEKINESKRAGSFGYVDPFGIRRVVYYNASPEKGFVHRNHNRYVGLGAQPYDEPQPQTQV